MTGSKKRKYFVSTLMLVLAFSFYFMLPRKLFNSPYSTVIYGQNGVLLGARIADDGQWRFPPQDSLPGFYKKAVLTFEDKNFYSHLGIDPFAIGRAIVANIKAGGIKEGGSTITMQVTRMALKNQPRTFSQKIKEMLLAVRLEMSYSKEDILGFYAAHAPFGGNVVGIEAAAWRYFSRPPAELSAAEYALLAILPNAPSALHPGKNNEALLYKRNALLKRMYELGDLDSLDYQLSILENLPKKPNPLPDLAPHVSQWTYINKRGQAIQTTIESGIQQQSKNILESFHQKYKQNGVHNAAILVADVKTGRVLAYLGNTKAGAEHGEYVDVIQSPRSSGSILKPFLFSAMQHTGGLLPNQLVADIPTFLSGFSPENYTRMYEGAVPASEALARSLNVPAVRELKQFGVSRFKQELQNVGFSTVNRSADNYGLSLILGGAEVKLWDVCNAYLGMSQAVLSASDRFKPTQLHLFPEDSAHSRKSQHAAASYLTLTALRTSNHNYNQSGIHDFINNKIAWKTGTSFGFRDAWAVGVNANYVVAVWVGNADGEGRPGIVGGEAAAPIMFQIFSSLPNGYNWFVPPYNSLVEIETCSESGFLASQNCPTTKKVWATNGSENATLCKFHQPVLLTKNNQFRVDKSCSDTTSVNFVNWFVLPPAWEFYYKKTHPGYQLLPPVSPDCKVAGSSAPMELIYPTNFQKVYSAKQLSGENGPIVFKLAHRNQSKRVFWHANDKYLGETKEIHDLPVVLAPGSYLLRVVDEDGFEISQRIQVL